MEIHTAVHLQHPRFCEAHFEECDQHRSEELTAYQKRQNEPEDCGRGETSHTVSLQLLLSGPMTAE